MKKTVLSVVIAIFYCFLSNAQVDGDKLEQIPMDLKVYDLEGNSTTLGDIVNHDGLVLLDFWATWCKPCLFELETLKDEAPIWEKEYNAKVVLISIDDTSKIGRINKLAAKKEWAFDKYIDMDKESRAKMGVTQIPNMFLVDNTGKVLLHELGYSKHGVNKIHKTIKKNSK